jgi:acyl CoA:acetate/3-ketoacid CoA transferase beta subunit
VKESGFLVQEMLHGMTEEELQARSEAPLSFAANLKPLATPDI